MMPGERYEVIIDFSAVAGPGHRCCANTARTPYPAGAPVNGSTTGRIMRVQRRRRPRRLRGPTRYDPATAALPVAGDSDGPSDRPRYRHHAGATGRHDPQDPPPDPQRGDRRRAVRWRSSSTTPCTTAASPACRRTDFTPITTQWNTTYYSELPHEGETELWEIVNLTADAHPIHPHLVAFQVLNRQAFDVKALQRRLQRALPRHGHAPRRRTGRRWTTTAAAPATAGPRRSQSDGLPCVGGNPDRGAVPRGPARSRRCADAAGDRLEGHRAARYPGQITRVLVRFAPTDRAGHRDAGQRCRVRLQPEPRPRVRLALPHRRPRGQRDDAAVQRVRRTRRAVRTYCRTATVRRDA